MALLLDGREAGVRRLWVSGWISPAREQLAGGRLIRPQWVYVGPPVSQAA